MNLSCVELSFSLKHCRYFIFLGPILFIKNFQVIDLFIYIVLYIYVRVCVCVCISRLTESLKILLSRRWYCHVERCKSLWDTHEEARKLPRCRGKGGQCCSEPPVLVYDIFLKLILMILKSPGGLMQSNGLEHYILTEHLCFWEGIKNSEISIHFDP